MMMRRRSLLAKQLSTCVTVCRSEVVRKRLKLTDAQLADIIRKTGNSISAISKEAGARQCLSLPKHNTNGCGDRRDASRMPQRRCRPKRYERAARRGTRA